MTDKVYYVYILYSEKVNKYYTGFTSLTPLERLTYHNYKNKSFTNQAEDWEIVHYEQFDLKKDALIREKQIKKRGAKRYLEDLKTKI